MTSGNELSTSKEKQKTLKHPVSVSGIGLFTGVKSTMTLIPAAPNSGISFQRVDLPSEPILPAKVEYVRGTPRCTIIGDEDVYVQTVEHVLSALKAYDIDNLLIQIDAHEVPSCDGSALPFVELIEKAGIKYQAEPKMLFRVKEPIFWTRGEVSLVALPSEDFRISYTLNYPNSDFLKAQFYSTVITPEIFKKDIAPARTFSLYEEIVPLIEKGSIKGGSLENAVIVKGNQVLNPEGVRFEDEMVRHKVLDLIGDLSLVGIPFCAHVIAIRSGHFSNTSLAKELVNYLNVESAKMEAIHAS